MLKPARRSGRLSKTQTAHNSSPDKRLGRSRNGKRRVIAAPPIIDEKHEAAVRDFETAMRHLQGQRYARAREIFDQLVAKAPPDVADRSRVLLRVCLERTAAKTPVARTAGDYHVLGVAELNARNLDRAVEHLRKAQKLQPKREEIRYALAAAYALKGDTDAALEHLKASIGLRPQNRFQARHDRDFASLSGDPRFWSLVREGAIVQRAF